MRTEVNINADMITWAIVRAGHDLHEFLIDSPRISDWLEDKKNQLLNNLKNFLIKYIFLLDTFFYKIHLKRIYLFLFSELEIKKKKMLA